MDFGQNFSKNFGREHANAPLDDMYDC